MVNRIGEIVNGVNKSVTQGNEVQLKPRTVGVAVLIKRIYCDNPIQLKVTEVSDNSYITSYQSSTDFIGKDLNIITTDNFIWSVIQQGNTACNIIWYGIVIYDYNTQEGVKPIQFKDSLSATGDSKHGDYGLIVYDNGVSAGTMKSNIIMSEGGFEVGYGNSPFNFNTIKTIPTATPLILNQALLAPESGTALLMMHNTESATKNMYYEGIEITASIIRCGKKMITEDGQICNTGVTEDGQICKNRITKDGKVTEIPTNSAIVIQAPTINSKASITTPQIIIGTSNINTPPIKSKTRITTPILQTEVKTTPIKATAKVISPSLLITATKNVIVQGNILGDNPMSAPKPDDDIVFQVDGIEYRGLENFQVEKRGNDAASTFDVSYLTAEDLLIMTGQKITFKERYGNKDGFYSGVIQDIKDSYQDEERTWTITGRDTGSKLISQPFTLPCAESNPTQYTSYQLLNMILDGTNVELGPYVDITVTGIVNQNNVFRGFGGNWDTRAAALNDLLALCSRVLSKNVNWFIDKKGLLRIFYTDIPDTSIGISILKDNPRMLNLEVDENSENLVNDLTGTAGENNELSTHLQDSESINGWTDPDTGLSWPGYGTQTGEPIQDSTIKNQSDLNAKVQNELNLHSKPIFTVTIVLSRFPSVEMGQPLYLPDHYKLRGITFVITAITLNGNSADRTTTIVATTDRAIIGPLSDYEAVNSIAKYAVKGYAPFKGVITEVGNGSVTVQPVNESATINATKLGG